LTTHTLHCKLCGYQFTHDDGQTHHFMDKHLDLMFKFPEMEKLAAIIQIHFLEQRDIN